MSYGTGRIGEILNHLEATNGIPISKIDAQTKLNALCDSLQMSHHTFDRMISENSPVFRTVKGHAFESFFDYLLQANNVSVKEVGGDDAIDRVDADRKLTHL